MDKRKYFAVVWLAADDTVRYTTAFEAASEADAEKAVLDWLASRGGGEFMGFVD